MNNNEWLRHQPAWESQFCCAQIAAVYSQPLFVGETCVTVAIGLEIQTEYSLSSVGCEFVNAVGNSETRSYFAAEIRKDVRVEIFENSGVQIDCSHQIQLVGLQPGSVVPLVLQATLVNSRTGTVFSVPLVGRWCIRTLSTPTFLRCLRRNDRAFEVLITRMDNDQQPTFQPCTPGKAPLSCSCEFEVKIRQAHVRHPQIHLFYSQESRCLADGLQADTEYKLVVRSKLCGSFWGPWGEPMLLRTLEATRVKVLSVTSSSTVVIAHRVPSAEEIPVVERFCQLAVGLSDEESKVKVRVATNQQLAAKDGDSDSDMDGTQEATSFSALTDDTIEIEIPHLDEEVIIPSLHPKTTYTLQYFYIQHNFPELAAERPIGRSILVTPSLVPVDGKQASDESFEPVIINQDDVKEAATAKEIGSEEQLASLKTAAKKFVATINPCISSTIKYVAETTAEIRWSSDFMFQYHRALRSKHADSGIILHFAQEMMSRAKNLFCARLISVPRGEISTTKLFVDRDEFPICELTGAQLSHLKERGGRTLVSDFEVPVGLQFGRNQGEEEMLSSICVCKQVLCCTSSSRLIISDLESDTRYFVSCCAAPLPADCDFSSQALVHVDWFPFSPVSSLITMKIAERPKITSFYNEVFRFTCGETVCQVERRNVGEDYFTTVLAQDHKTDKLQRFASCEIESLDEDRQFSKTAVLTRDPKTYEFEFQGLRRDGRYQCKVRLSLWDEGSFGTVAPALYFTVFHGNVVSVQEVEEGLVVNCLTPFAKMSDYPGNVHGYATVGSSSKTAAFFPVILTPREIEAHRFFVNKLPPETYSISLHFLYANEAPLPTEDDVMYDTAGLYNATTRQLVSELWRVLRGYFKDGSGTVYRRHEPIPIHVSENCLVLGAAPCARALFEEYSLNESAIKHDELFGMMDCEENPFSEPVFSRRDKLPHFPAIFTHSLIEPRLIMNLSAAQERQMQWLFDGIRVASGSLAELLRRQLSNIQFEVWNLHNPKEYSKTISLTASETHAVAAGLEGGVEYAARVRVQGRFAPMAGAPPNWSDWSRPIAIRTAPRPVMECLSVTESSMIVTWHRPGVDAPVKGRKQVHVIDVTPNGSQIDLSSEINPKEDKSQGKPHSYLTKIFANENSIEIDIQLMDIDAAHAQVLQHTRVILPPFATAVCARNLYPGMRYCYKMRYSAAGGAPSAGHWSSKIAVQTLSDVIASVTTVGCTYCWFKCEKILVKNVKELLQEQSQNGEKLKRESDSEDDESSDEQVVNSVCGYEAKLCRVRQGVQSLDSVDCQLVENVLPVSATEAPPIVVGELEPGAQYQLAIRPNIVGGLKGQWNNMLRFHTLELILTSFEVLREDMALCRIEPPLAKAILPLHPALAERYSTFGSEKSIAVDVTRAEMLVTGRFLPSKSRSLVHSLADQAAKATPKTVRFFLFNTDVKQQVEVSASENADCVINSFQFLLEGLLPDNLYNISCRSMDSQGVWAPNSMAITLLTRPALSLTPLSIGEFYAVLKLGRIPRSNETGQIIAAHRNAVEALSFARANLQQKIEIARLK